MRPLLNRAMPAFVRGERNGSGYGDGRRINQDLRESLYLFPKTVMGLHKCPLTIHVLLNLQVVL